MLIRTNSECDVPWWRRQLICHPVKINGTAMAIPLTQTKDKMFFLYDAWRRDWLDFARKEKWLRIFISKRLQHFVPVQKFDVDVSERELVIQSQAGLQSFFRKKLARSAPKCFGKTIEIFLPHCQPGRHLVPAVFVERSAQRLSASTKFNPSMLRPLPFPKPLSSKPITIAGR